ncbi:hypothetical protein Lal_00031100 [Lupinus albus]|nr:hypothetical protein Lal_00031100 [Lupinus albus]
MRNYSNKLLKSKNPYNNKAHKIGLQIRTTEGTEFEVSLHSAVAKPTPQGIRDRRRRRRRRWQGVRLRKHEFAIIAIQESVLSRPTPNGNEEEFENLIVLNKINGGATINAPSHT